jgi:hypothetical protein
MITQIVIPKTIGKMGVDNAILFVSDADIGCSLVIDFSKDLGAWPAAVE